MTRLVIRGGQVWDPAGDVHAPALRDVLVEGNRIAAVLPPGDPLTAQWISGTPEIIEAAGRLVMPGFVNAHFHSYDALVKGLLEDMPFDVWALHTQPAYYGKRSRAEIRGRVLVGAIECLKNGITTVQDMNSLVPQDEETLDLTLAAFAEVGIRVVWWPCATSPRSTSRPSLRPTCRTRCAPWSRAPAETRPPTWPSSRRSWPV